MYLKSLPKHEKITKEQYQKSKKDKEANNIYFCETNKQTRIGDFTLGRYNAFYLLANEKVKKQKPTQDNNKEEEKDQSDDAKNVSQKNGNQGTGKIS